MKPPTWEGSLWDWVDVDRNQDVAQASGQPLTIANRRQRPEQEMFAITVKIFMMVVMKSNCHLFLVKSWTKSGANFFG